ncbi:maleylacetate reductase [Roseivivax sediminis]|uniref:Maleylacetate reductase n=1 Tax=Roseivivax sediminis TaxID=936889 RepID=A0A1I1T3B0_9RHOB|nr:maleylacetate reductase [Roseivivax sediminis]SFD53177.1 maleylacetate reductase [Roseivivax sediminis]
MMDTFTFPGITQRVIFGSGTLTQTAEEVQRLGHDKALVLSGPNQRHAAEALAAQLGALSAGVFAGAAMHTPVEVTETAMAEFRASGATAVVGLGGGSTVGLAKAIAARSGADQVVIPTTYAGSEMTDILGETQGGEKTTRRSPDIRPETVIYDVDLTLDLPVEMTVASAMNALAHAMEALYAPDLNPVLELLCKDALVAFRNGLPAVIRDPQNLQGRTRALYGAWACSTALGHVSMALHHKLAHTFGGTFDTPHADTHAILLPYTTAFNEVAVPELLAPIAETFGGGSAGAGLWDFAGEIGAPRSLQDIGIAEPDLDRAADIAVKNTYPNPRRFDRAAIRDLLQHAWAGDRPAP